MYRENERKNTHHCNVDQTVDILHPILFQSITSLYRTTICHSIYIEQFYRILFYTPELSCIEIIISSSNYKTAFIWIPTTTAIASFQSLTFTYLSYWLSSCTWLHAHYINLSRILIYSLIWLLFSLHMLFFFETLCIFVATVATKEKCHISVLDDNEMTVHHLSNTSQLNSKSGVQLWLRQ